MCVRGYNVPRQDEAKGGFMKSQNNKKTILMLLMLCLSSYGLTAHATVTILGDKENLEIDSANYTSNRQQIISFSAEKIFSTSDNLMTIDCTEESNCSIDIDTIYATYLEVKGEGLAFHRVKNHYKEIKENNVKTLTFVNITEKGDYIVQAFLDEEDSIRLFDALNVSPKSDAVSRFKVLDSNDHELEIMCSLDNGSRDLCTVEIRGFNK